MIETEEHLAIYVADAIKAHGACRLYVDMLEKVWYFTGLGRHQAQEERIRAFAESHGWDVIVHTPGGYGLVADFTPASTSA